jgi:hypothetical protein
MRFYAILALGALLAAPASAARTKYIFDGVGVYGTNSLTAKQIEEKIGEQARRYYNRRGVKSKMVKREAARMRKKIAADVKKMGDFAWLQLHEIRVPSEDGQRHYLFFFEVIEKKDMSRRMPFRDAPKDTVKDTSGLLEAYAKYDAAGWALVRKNELRVERQDCPAYYCTWGGARPELARLQAAFSGKVTPYKKLLIQVMQEDKDPARRANAIYLLTYHGDGAELSNAISHGLIDPSAKVREAAMNVYTDIAIYNSELPIPVHQILRHLDFPLPEDRDRALSLMLSLANNPDYRSFLLHKASTPILKLLRDGSPANREMAHTVLRLMSDVEYKRDDYEAWEKWVWKARREKSGE